VEPRRVSVDAIEHWMIYQEHPGVGAIVHVHAWVDGIEATDVNYPCGTEELARAVADLVRAEDDPLTHAYLRALGRRIGVEMSVNTSFNVAGPIAQTPSQAIDTLRRSKGLDVVLLVVSDGAVHAAWHGGERDSGRFSGWLLEWKSSPAGKLI